MLCCEVLEHLEDPAAGLAEIARVASRTCLVSVPREPIWRMLNVARGAYWSALGNTPGHLNHWSRAAFSAFVGTRLDVVETASPLPWTVVLARDALAPQPSRVSGSKTFHPHRAICSETRPIMKMTTEVVSRKSPKLVKRCSVTYV